MDNRSDVRDFLASRRAKVSPAESGLPIVGGNRRVPGLRREEVALLAGVSVDYYTRLERGNLSGASDSVLEAVARALQLDEAERAHLFDLARTANATTTGKGRTTSGTRVRPGIQRMLEAISGPAYVSNGRGDIVAANTLGQAVFAPIFDAAAQPPNTARFAFLDTRATDFFSDWEHTADSIVAGLRAQAGRNPHDRALTDLVGELSVHSEDFRLRWATHNVRFHRTGTKTLRHPLVGDLELAFETLEFPSEPGFRLAIYTVEPNSPAEQALNLLASWTTNNPPSVRAN